MPVFDETRDGAVPLPTSPRPRPSSAASRRGCEVALERDGGPADAARVAAYVDAGASWSIEGLGWWRGDLEAARARIAAGPPT